MKKKNIIVIGCAMLAAFTGCNRILDKTDLGSVNEALTWTDPASATAYVNNLYTSLPNWSTAESGYADESDGRGPVNNGAWSPDNNPLWYWPYDAIRNVNVFFKQIPTATLAADLKQRLSGESHFIRAYLYFAMVKRFGGVPVIEQPQSITDNIFVKRNKTSETYSFVLKELDAAIAQLPSVQSDKGRVTKGAAMAFKGRVLLFWASPQFNPSNDVQRWQAAYDANLAARQELENNGAGLYADFSNLFLDEMNKEVVFAIRFLNPGRTQSRDAEVRPISVSVNHTGGNHPTEELVEAFPLDNGADWQPTANTDDQWLHRDARFYATIVYNGASYFSRTQWTYENAGIDAYGAPNGTHTGYYNRKAINQVLTAAEANSSGTDYIDIRFAEVLMNEAETANELGNTAVAYDVLKLIRDRAKIQPGANGLYGLPAGMSVAAMRTRLQKERFVEFAFEQKRYWDLRRWKLTGTVLNGVRRHGLVGTKISDNPLKFSYNKVDLDLQGDMVFKDYMYFAPISRSELQNNQNMQQNTGWENGTFDPLQ
ncbi:putative outer membrane starch-binding protein [Chitinophaga niastensis]|uniref:Putative outer membrane starch-binding protein n=1 Tax=Chitinophaga niastensis TaxID=536980 RepID=A0A2P8HVK3_CHINA|nr:RagB/SusD family nutrient uptake outer membrane protein [Chitinophaga niastensis]PSL50273.1 putative outer membrane starch-binding protein [Chitinophaga niastensis]